MTLIFAHLAILAFCGLVTTFVMVIYLWCDERRIRNKYRQLNHQILARQNGKIIANTGLARLAEQLHSNQITQASALPIKNNLLEAKPILPSIDPASTTTSSSSIEIHTHV